MNTWGGGASSTDRTKSAAEVMERVSAKHKYIRHRDHGFLVWPAEPPHKVPAHVDLARAVGRSGVISAGFVTFSPAGDPFIFGESESLDMKPLPDDADALRLQILGPKC